MVGAAATARVRLADVAKAAGVHRTVAGKVLLGGESNSRLSPATAERVRQAADRLGYTPNHAARQLRGVRSRLLGVLVSSRMNEASFERFQAIEQEARRRGFRIAPGFVSETDDVRDFLADFDSRSVEAVIYADTPWAEHVSSFAGRPVVFTIRPALTGACCVELDRAMSGSLAVEHLIERGRRRIGLVVRALDTWSSKLRHRGYLEAMRRGLGVDARDLVWMAPTTDRKVFSHADEAVEFLVGRMGCDAIVAGDDRWAVRLIEALRRRNLSVPGDVAIVGHNNMDITTVVTPYLTTIDQQHPILAGKVLDMTEELITRGSIPTARRRVLVPPRLVVRDST